MSPGEVASNVRCQAHFSEVGSFFSGILDLQDLLDKKSSNSNIFPLHVRLTEILGHCFLKLSLYAL